MAIRVPLAQGQVTGAVAAMVSTARPTGAAKSRKRKTTAAKRASPARRKTATKRRKSAPKKGSAAMKRRMAKVRAARKR